MASGTYLKRTGERVVNANAITCSIEHVRIRRHPRYPDAQDYARLLVRDCDLVAREIVTSPAFLLRKPSLGV